MPASHSEVHVGQALRWERAFTEDEIRRFMDLSGDRGIHHQEKNAEGKLLAHGLLTATLPTKLGGDLDYIARTMTFEFLKGVYSGDTLTCLGVVDAVKPGRAFTRVSFSFTVTNQASVVVMKGTSSGVIAVRT